MCAVRRAVVAKRYRLPQIHAFVIADVVSVELIAKNGELLTRNCRCSGKERYEPESVGAGSTSKCDN